MENQEIELKFGVPQDVLGRLGEHPAFAAPAQASELRSVYFDTPTHALKRRSLGLRVREGEGARRQTLKLDRPTSPTQRSEWETEVRGDRPDLAALADTPAAAVLKDGEVAPVFITTVERTRRLWTKGEDVVEVSLDQGAITCGARSEPVQELELELKTGEPQALYALAAELAGQLNLRLLFASKAQRGYRLAEAADRRPQKGQVGGVDGETPAADGFRDVAQACLTQVAANAELLRERRSPEALHQTRVGLRRFRAALSAYRPMVEDAEFEALKTETKWLAGELDRARNLDVFIHDAFRATDAGAAQRGAFASFGSQLLHAQSQAYVQALTALDSPRFARLLLQISAWLNVGAWLRSEDPKAKALRERRSDDFAGKRLDRAHRQVLKRGRKFAKLDDERRHRLRIKAKKLRYAAEFFADSFGRAKRRDRFFEALERLQDDLGVLNDAAVAPGLAREVVADRSADAGFAAGVIVGARRGAIPKAVRRASKRFARFERARPFWG
jgi:inorganic triphosphatase YgiF